MYIIRQCKNNTSLVKGMATVQSNHYDALGVKKNATQGEIKTAYYELSKLYHPDTNKGSEESLTKFRQVTNAYEVLGNVKSRKMYDRSLDIGGGRLRDEDVVDDPVTQFYKQREKRSKVPVRSEGGPTVYDFDAWTKAHYGKARDRRMAAKSKYDYQMDMKIIRANHRKNDIVYMTLSIIMLVVIALKMIDTSDDRPNVNKSVKQRVES